MKTHIEIFYQDELLKFSAHELLELMRDVVLEVSKNKKRQLRGPSLALDEGKIVPSVIPMTVEPQQWISEAQYLEQGGGKVEEELQKKQSLRFQKIISLKSYEFYRKNVEQLRNIKLNPHTAPVWNYSVKSLEEFFSKFNFKEINVNDFLKSAKEFLTELSEKTKNDPQFVTLVFNTYKAKFTENISSGVLTDLQFLVTNKILTEQELYNQFEFEIGLLEELKDFSVEVRYNIYQDVLGKALNNLEYSIESVKQCIKELCNKKNNQYHPRKDARKKLIEFFKINKLWIYKELPSSLQQCVDLIETSLFTCTYGTSSLLERACLLAHLDNSYWTDISSIQLQTIVSKDNVYPVDLLKEQLEKAMEREARLLIYSRKQLYKRYNAVFLLLLMHKRKIIFKEISYSSALNVDLLKKYSRILKALVGDEFFSVSVRYSFLHLLQKQGFSVDLSDDEIYKFIQPSKGERENFVPSDEMCYFMFEVTKTDLIHDKPYHEPKEMYYQLAGLLMRVDNYSDRYVYHCGEARLIEKRSISDIKAEIKKLMDKLPKFLEDISDLKRCWDNFTTAIKSVSIFRDTAPILFHSGQATLDYASSLKNLEYCRDYMYSKMFYILDSILNKNFENAYGFDLKWSTPSTRKEASYRGLYRGILDMSDYSVTQILQDILTGRQKYLNKDKYVIVLIIFTWLMAETSRNPLTFPISLMLLDMMVCQFTYGKNKSFSWKNVLWHPETIGATHSDGTNVEKMKGEERIEKYSKEELWGGKHPMCHEGSYVMNFKNKGDEWKIGNSLSVPRQKEATLLLHWLYYQLNHVFPGMPVRLLGTKDAGAEKSIVGKIVRGKKVVGLSYNITRGAQSSSETKKKFQNEVLYKIILERMMIFGNLLQPEPSLSVAIKYAEIFASPVLKQIVEYQSTLYFKK
ncbi:MAG: hypothetical protein JSS53_03885 [Proteobacteria bacterium]|nr:hypothetical protein [Pseudomonadota bacterium]